MLDAPNSDDLGWFVDLKHKAIISDPHLPKTLQIAGETFPVSIGGGLKPLFDRPANSFLHICRNPVQILVDIGMVQNLIRQ